ncbi:enoyl-CoA hydratase/isomerase family protein [Caballeronia sp. SEWSISQ10-4 2]|uniref:enoyl-CoA hydratase/isomerase family protein n=1 Tax=Caballeronia sp. SEWSISQ10-4 2 TaxID=2937438 RepID=UPI0026547824|nr:enoyl-CoA hydratase/isomerase family protein [Caballeronia sp. SEWSISQ10-4 2]MDN7182835.1 enoyl-CoA hydratase/isomerase family protein [Caballeronia sp. SEWSISQ10-4 2]
MSKQFLTTRINNAYWRVVFSHPPMNLIDPDTILEFQQLVGEIETDENLRVVVFESSDPDYFFSRYDLARAAETPTEPGPSGLPTWIDMTTRISQTPVVSIALIRGRTRGGGSELALAMDMRFASLEKAVFGQPEVAAGVLPGGGAIERLPLLTGRARALEIILGADDFDARAAEHYGWINRALPDAALDVFVDNLAQRIASFDQPALREAKRLINRRSLPAAADLLETQNVFLTAVSSWPSLRARGQRIRERAAGLGREFELRLGHFLGKI